MVNHYVLNDHFFYTQLAFAFAPQKDCYYAYLFFLLQLNFDIFLWLFLPFVISFFGKILICFNYFFLSFFKFLIIILSFLYTEKNYKEYLCVSKISFSILYVFELCKFSGLCTLYELNKLYELRELCTYFMNHLKIS